MILFSHTLTPRLQYVVDFLSDYYSTPIKIISDEVKYKETKDPHRINYSFHRISNNEVWIHSHVLLFETAIRQVKIESFDHPAHSPENPEYKAFFKAEGDTGFDLFAGMFYLLSRYEEYLPFKKDAYGRYSYENSLAFKANFLHLPLINIWLNDFKSLLEERFPGLQLSTPQFKYLPTYDIDIAWSYKNKGAKRNAVALIGLFFKGSWRIMANRIRVLRGKRQDPYDAYDWMDELHRTYSLHPIYFFLVAVQKGKLDRNIDVENEEFQQLVRSLSSKYQIGLHPSWASGDHPALLTKEKAFLENIIESPVVRSRQHFIRFDLPATYRRLVALGITNDYSMGYGSINGFRASITTPFYWYDLKNDHSTRLIIHPFCFMEATSFYEQKFTAENAFDEIMHYLQIVRAVNGTMITIWHNSFLGTDPVFAGWREMYLQFISEVTAG